MRTEFGILVAQGFSAPSAGEKLLFQEIILDSGEKLKVTDADAAEMVKDARVNSRVKVEFFETPELGERRHVTVLDSDQDRIDHEDYRYGSSDDPMLSIPGYPF